LTRGYWRYRPSDRISNARNTSRIQGVPCLAFIPQPTHEKNSVIPFISYLRHTTWPTTPPPLPRSPLYCARSAPQVYIAKEHRQGRVLGSCENAGLQRAAMPLVAEALVRQIDKLYKPLSHQPLSYTGGNILSQI